MKKLQLKKVAADVAFDTASQNLSFLDAALSAKAAELKLSDQEYQDLRSTGLLFRAQFVAAYQADLNAAKLAAPKPAPATVPAAPKQS